MAKRKNGEGTWGKKNIKGTEYVYFRDGNGKYFYGKNETEIKRKIKEYEKTIITISEDKRKVYFGDYILKWLQEVKQYSVKRRTYDGYYDLVNNMIIKYKGYDIANKQFLSLTPQMFQNYFNDLSRKYSRASIKKVYAIICMCLKYANDCGDININLLKNVVLPSEDIVSNKKKKIQFLNDSDMEKIYNESKVVFSKDRPYGTFGTPVHAMSGYADALIMYTGLRVGELLGLEWKDIDFENKKITVLQNSTRIKNRNKKTEEDNSYVREDATTKTASSVRKIPMSNRAFALLKEFEKININHKPSDKVIINYNGNVINERNLTRTLHSMLKGAKCDVQKCGLHALRHTFGSYLIRNGVDIKVVSRLLGHKDVTTTYNIYIHLIDEQLIDAVNLFNKKEEV